MNHEQIAKLNTDDAARYFNKTFIKARRNTTVPFNHFYVYEIGVGAKHDTTLMLKGHTSSEAMHVSLHDCKDLLDISFPETGLYNTHGTVVDLKRFPSRSTIKAFCGETADITSILYRPDLGVPAANLNKFELGSVRAVRDLLGSDKLLGNWEGCYKAITNFDCLAAAFNREYAIGAAIDKPCPWLFRRSHVIGYVPGNHEIVVTELPFLQETRDTFEVMGIRVRDKN